ncbi:hypothetical protein QYF36_026482 [Acer negundo]|nr:hypothetical protein QYF36_026482 [Acer negundo]
MYSEHIAAENADGFAARYLSGSHSHMHSATVFEFVLHLNLYAIHHTSYATTASQIETDRMNVFEEGQSAQKNMFYDPNKANSQRSRPVLQSKQGKQSAQKNMFKYSAPWVTTMHTLAI